MAVKITLEELREKAEGIASTWLHTDDESVDLRLSDYQKFLLHFGITEGLRKNQIYIPAFTKMLADMLDEHNRITEDQVGILRTQLGNWGVNTNDLVKLVINRKDIDKASPVDVINTFVKMNDLSHRRWEIYSAIRICVRDMDYDKDTIKGDGLMSTKGSVRRLLKVLVDDPGMMVARLWITYGLMCKTRNVKPDETINIFLYSIVKSMFNL